MTQQPEIYAARTANEESNVCLWLIDTTRDLNE
jgi:hypothetical protein